MFDGFIEGICRVFRKTIVVSLLVSLAPWVGRAQEKTEESSTELSRRVTELAALVQKLQTRVDELEGKSHVSSQPAVSDSSMAAPAQSSMSQASPTPSGPRSGSSLLGGTTVNPEFRSCSVAHNRRSRLCQVSTHAEARNSRKDRISLRPWRPLHRDDAGDQREHAYLGAKARRWVDHAGRMAPRRFQPSVLPDRHARDSEKGAEYRHSWNYMVVWG